MKFSNEEQQQQQQQQTGYEAELFERVPMHSLYIQTVRPTPVRWMLGGCHLDEKTRDVLRKQMLDNFVFRNGSIACSLEYEQLRQCFHRQRHAAPDAPKVPDRHCNRQAKRYGNCLYRRFDSAANYAVCILPCRSDYILYKLCRGAVATMNNAIVGNELGKFEEKSVVEDYCYPLVRDFFVCVETMMSIDYANPLNEPQNEGILRPPL